MRGPPIEKIGPEPGRIVAQRVVSCHRSADGVDDARVLDHSNTPAGFARPQAKLNVLAIEADPFVERTGNLPTLAANGHRRAADPVNLAQTLLPVRLSSKEAGKPPRATHHSDHPRQGRLRAAAP